MSGHLIAIGGKLRAGKDAVADHLVAEHGFVKIGMSDALHEALLAIDPWVRLDPGYDTPKARERAIEHKLDQIPERYSSVVERMGYVEAKRLPEVRRLLQKLGTEVGRDMIDEDVWVDITRGTIRRLFSEDKDVVLTGARFRNELRLAESFGGETWWVERPGLSVPTVGGHASENSVAVGDFARVILNDGTLERLYAKVDYLRSMPGVVTA